VDALAQAQGQSSDGRDLLGLVAAAVASAEAGRTTEEFADSLGLGRGVGGYVYHTVPVALHAWFRHPQDLPAAIEEVVRCGGDTDTTAAIVGGIVGAGVGARALPGALVNGLWEWPRSVSWMRRLGHRLAGAVAAGKPQPALPLPFVFSLPRNLLFLMVVLAHGFRRLLPPY
jgi:ADP-ribosyl-[dinitrogen reductase] hydrolase